MGRRKKKEAIIDIVAFSGKGNGLGYYINVRNEECPVEVRGAVPGDVVKVVLARRVKRRYISSVEEFITMSPEREPLRCKHAGVCGGCSMQHVPYHRQTNHKESAVRELFSGYSDTAVFHDIIPCEDPWYYRNRMDFSFSQDAAGEKFAGLMMPMAKARVVDIEECYITSRWCVEALDAVRQWWKNSDLEAYYHPKDKGTLREVMFREGKNTGDRMAVLTVSGNPDYALVHDDIAAFVEAIRASCEDENHKVSIFIRIQQLVAGKPTEFYEMHLYGPEYVREILDVGDRGAITVNISPAAFFQPNTIQTEKLYALALEHADITEEDVVYDLYCGTGTIGLCVSKAAKKVVGIELSPEAVLDARENIKDNNIENMEVIQGDVGTALADVDDNVDVVIVDPPRSGLDEDAIANILRLRPKKIVYISCNPKTQAKNVADIVAEGYSLTSIQPIDQFPHTPHIENIVIADRKNIDH